MISTFTPEKVLGHCPNCGPNRWATVVGHHKKREEADPIVWFQIDHRILECPACEEVYHQTCSVYSEDCYVAEYDHEGNAIWDFEKTIHHWPEPLQLGKEKPDWIKKLNRKDVILEDLTEDIYKAISAGLPVMAVIGIRTLFDRATEVLGIDPAIPFADKISNLQTEGYIGLTERDILSIAIDAGSAAAHRGWKPSGDELQTALEVVEQFLHRTFILRDNATSLKSSIPPKPKRQRASKAPI